MAQGKPQLKFERNPYNNFRDNRCHRRTTDGRTTDDGRTSRAKNEASSMKPCDVIEVAVHDL